ncbi:histidine kinase [Streptomyces sp. NPDC051976]|uniref:sensor histidine kinase n=1 Tax=Streptomyces sp. NPDC051976 TaxID=3154947 RepID=UPI00343876EA
MDGTRTAPAPRHPSFSRTHRLGAGARALWRLAALCAVASLGAVPLVAIVCVSRALLDDGTRPSTVHGPYHTWALLITGLVGLGVVRTRWVVRRTRRLVGRWCGVRIPDPYRPAPVRDRVAGETGSVSERWRRIAWLLGDPATWRDLVWTGLNAVVGAGALLVPLGLTGAYGLSYLFFGPPAGPPDRSAPIAPPPDRLAPPLPTHGGVLGGPVHSLLTGKPVALTLAALLCCAWLAAVLLAAPRLLAGYGRLAGLLLGPTREARLAQRVTHLAVTRSDTIDSGAAEMRRIERDLHDGAQARLVAMGMTLNAAEQLFASNPDAALALLTEAKQSSVKALAELRDLVRGIHPPVLADRGLVDAVRALALDLPLPARVDGDLPARAAAPVESAAYFAVSELLANVAKHAGAHRVWIDIGHTGEALRIGVTDDGRGGADPSRGTGLRGLERRLAAFDGVLALTSPPGGPTIASLEIPCALSSPKTSSS